MNFSPLIINNVFQPNGSNRISIEVKNGLIASVSEKPLNTDDSFIGDMVFPGLINMHEHLSFDLFPPLANRKYLNYLEWGNDIHARHARLIRSVLNTPFSKRVRLGELRNLASGVTSLCNHELIPVNVELIDMFNNYTYFHAPSRSLKWILGLLRKSRANKELMIHLNEGVGKHVDTEINFLKRWNLFGRKIIAIHGLSFNPNNVLPDALIWCPSSNQFLYGRTAPIHDLIDRIPIFLGTDSTLSGPANIWEHIRNACDILGSTEKVFELLTLSPAAYFPEFKNKGKISVGFDADLVVAEKKHDDYWSSFYSLNPADIKLVIKSGKVVFTKSPMAGFKRIEVFGTSAYMPENFVYPLNNLKFDFKPPFEVKIYD